MAGAAAAHTKHATRVWRARIGDVPTLRRLWLMVSSRICARERRRRRRTRRGGACGAGRTVPAARVSVEWWDAVPKAAVDITCITCRARAAVGVLRLCQGRRCGPLGVTARHAAMSQTEVTCRAAVITCAWGADSDASMRVRQHDRSTDLWKRPQICGTDVLGATARTRVAHCDRCGSSVPWRACGGWR